MEIITEFVQNQLMFVVPFCIVIVGCILFTYGIRPAPEPKFNLSALDDKKTAGKKKKLKEKKPSANGQVSTGATKSEKSPAKEIKKSPEAKREKKVEIPVKESKKPEPTKKGTEVQESRKKIKKVGLEKPADFDDAGWETVPSKADKKKKAEQSPSKKEKKAKKQLAETEPVAQEEVGVEEEIPSTETVKSEPEPKVEAVEEPKQAEEAPAPVIEEKKEKKKEKKVKKEVKEAIPESKPTPAPKAVKEAPASEPEEESKGAPSASTGAAFDELGDTWTEAKPVKKSKKKARRDN